MPWHALPFGDRTRQQVLSQTFGVRGIPSLVLIEGGTGKLLETNARSKAVQPSFLASLPDLDDLVAPDLPPGPVMMKVRHNGKEDELECDPEDGWEVLKLQIYSITEIPCEQQRIFGCGSRGVLTDRTPLKNVIARGLAKQKILGMPLADVPVTSRKASTTWDNKKGTVLDQGHMGGKTSWSAQVNDMSQWHLMDMGSVKEAAGVVLAARADHGQWVTKFRILHAQAEDGPWVALENGREFVGNESRFEDPKRILFKSPVSARFIRIHPTAWNKHISLRADVILCGDGEAAIEPPVFTVLGNFCKDDPYEFAPSEFPPAPDRMMQEQVLAMLQAKLSSAPPRMQSCMSHVEGARMYEERSLQQQALSKIPVQALDQHIPKDVTEGYELAFLRQLLQWFKQEFFTWTNNPRCQQCNSDQTKAIGGAQPTPEERAAKAGNVEVYLCSACNAQTRFPRYNHPGKLLETRTGRCGEWANCFALICRALGYETRHVVDWTDHVWTEIYSDSLGRWVHADSCEAAMDTPLVYEQGWGKKLTYCIAFARDHVHDVTKRYTIKFDEVLTRRNVLTEAQLSRNIEALDEFAQMQDFATILPASVEDLLLIPHGHGMERTGDGTVTDRHVTYMVHWNGHWDTECILISILAVRLNAS